MIIEDVLFRLLSEDPDIAARVGTRIYPLLIPQGSKFPVIAYQRLSTERNYDMSGETGYMEIKMHVSCWDSGLDNYMNIKTLAEAILHVLSNARGKEIKMACAFAEARNMKIQMITIDDESDELVESPELAARELVGVRMDITITITF